MPGLLYLLVLSALFCLVPGCRGRETTRPPEQAESWELPPVEEQAPAERPGLLHPDDFVYLGAFRLPDDGERPHAFSYGGEAMTFNPQGNPGGPGEGLPGSLFIMGHNRMPHGELPEGNRVAEITIPAPIISSRVDDLNQAEFIQPLEIIDYGFFSTFDEIPRVGMEYLETPATGPLIHLAWGQHLHQPDSQTATHAWFSPNLSEPEMQGPWQVGDRSVYSVSDYLFSIPAEWAEQYAGGRLLATGRFKDGGWSGMGPALFAYQPWIDDRGNPAPAGSRLPEVVLLLYESSAANPNIEKCLTHYQHPDEWSGGAWITSGSGKTAVLFAGTKSTGDIYWYGFVNPAGPQFPCIESEFLGQFTLCRRADGTPCPNENAATCSNHSSNRGWWSSSFNACFVLYDPADLAMVAMGKLEPWEPQPYASLVVDEHLFLNPSGIETEMLGTGSQRRYRLGDAAYDRENDLIYVLELFADEARPVVHAWRVP